jgi:hypothetical protein
MLEVVTWAAWAVSAALLLWMFWDFMSINKNFSDDVLVSSREGVDDLFGEAGDAKRD